METDGWILEFRAQGRDYAKEINLGVISIGIAFLLNGTDEITEGVWVGR